MEAKELRIGNLLSFGKNIFKVYQLNEDNFYAKDYKNNESLKSSWAEIEPITLSEEWLLKFGFEIKQGRFGNEYLGKINLYTASDKKIVFCYDGYLKGIKYVHQLQNLYFALTGKELAL